MAKFANINIHKNAEDRFYDKVNTGFLLNIIPMNAQQVQLNIPLSFNQVVDIVRQLPPSEKQRLSEVLWDEQNIDTLVIPEAHKQIVRTRIKKYESSPDNYLSWDDIEDKMAARK